MWRRVFWQKPAGIFEEYVPFTVSVEERGNMFFQKSLNFYRTARRHITENKII